MVSESQSPSSVGGSDGSSAEIFAALLRNLWRAQLRVTRAAARLPESQVDLLRLLIRSGPMTPAELADELRLARPTVSNVLRDLRGSGLIERRQVSGDRRSVIVAATDRAREILDAFARTRVAAIEAVLGRLDADDRASIAAAVPALERLLAEFEREHSDVDEVG